MKYFIINALLFSLFFNLSVFNLLGESRERLFYDAVRAEASGDLEKAIEIYSTIAKESHSANLHANLANLYFKMEDYARSILHLRRAMWIAPENRNYSANLSLALDMNGVPTDDSVLNTNESTLFLLTSNQALILLTSFAWLGLILIIYFLKFPIITKFFVWASSIWLLGTSLLSLLYFQKSKDSSRLNREIIAVHSLNDNDQDLSLRVFAGKGSQANTTVPLGSSLLLDIDDEGFAKVHQSPTGEKWFLARSKTGKDKGWLQRSEFEPILDLEL